MSQIKRDFSGAVKKTKALLNIPRAAKKQATQWAVDSVRELKRSAASMQKSGRGRKTGQLARNIGMEISAGENSWRVLIGTGVARALSVKYAKIQDEGGTTHPTVTARMRKWAWFMFAKTGDDKFKAIALTRKSKLTVNIPASGWFTGIVDPRVEDLTAIMQPENVMKVAEGMAR